MLSLVLKVSIVSDLSFPTDPFRPDNLFSASLHSLTTKPVKKADFLQYWKSVPLKCFLA